MDKEKKIGMSFMLNDRLKPTNIEGEKAYPVYMVLSYDRKSNTFLAPIENDDDALRLTESEFEKVFAQKLDKRLNKKVSNLMSDIEQAIRFEVRMYGEKFSLSGFPFRLRRYRNNYLHDQLSIYLKKKLFAFLAEQFDQDIKYVSSQFHHSFTVPQVYFAAEELYKVRRLKDLFPNDLRLKFTAWLNFVALTFYSNQDKYEGILQIIDWLSDDVQQAFKNFLMYRTNEDVFLNAQNEDREIKSMYLEFSFSKNEIPALLNQMDFMIAEIVK